VKHSIQVTRSAGKNSKLKHYIVGGDGFVGRYLARALLSSGEEVVVCDIAKSELDIYNKASFVHLDITDRSAFDAVSFGRDDVIYHLAARMLIPIVRKSRRKDYLWSVNYYGTKNLLEYCHERGCSKLIYLTTDMVYGHQRQMVGNEEQPKEPLGPYGASKLASEELCETYREKGVRITIFRPRLIIGPGRMELLEKLFRLVRANLPVPLIGAGTNRFQFISVYDCVSAALCAVEKGIPNSVYNLASIDPPTTGELLNHLIKEVGSRSFLIRTPARFTKRVLTVLDLLGVPLMDPEQFLIADENCVLDVSKAVTELGWQPRYRDKDMLVAAYKEYMRITTETQ